MYNKRVCEKLYRGAIPGRMLHLLHDKYWLINPEEHCCIYLAAFINDARLPYKYSPALRLYYVSLGDSNSTIQALFYCPMCGKKLPNNLSDQYYKVLEEEYGITFNLTSYKKKNFPKEFKTDEWWKKRSIFSDLGW
jgi:hypothetical protein